MVDGNLRLRVAVCPSSREYGNAPEGMVTGV